ncbi:hypothetical protein EGW08_015594, partial [Elysia chlorotica]
MTDFCHANDIQHLRKHEEEVRKNGQNTSSIYRFKLAENRYVFVQTKSKLFNNNLTGKPEYIISTHSIIRECDSEVQLKGSASTSLMKSVIGPNPGRVTPSSLGHNFPAGLSSMVSSMQQGSSLGLGAASMGRGGLG